MGTLHKNCPYSELFWSGFFLAFSRIRTAFVFSPNAGKCGKNADQNNSEYGHFLRSGNYFSWAEKWFLNVVLHWNLSESLGAIV